MIRPARFVVSLAVVASLTSAAKAEEVEACSVAYARGQEERLAGRLYNARSAFQQCAAPACSALAADCSHWVKEVEADLPTIRITVRTQHGQAPDSLKVIIDGTAVALGTLSAPIVLEAGPHDLRFEAPGYAPVKVEKALRPSDREVEVSVTLRPPQAPVEAARGDAAPARPVPTTAWLLAGVGAAALGGSIYFGITANGEYQDLKGTCAPGCEPSASDQLYRNAVISDVALVGSVVAFTAAAIVYFTRPTRPPAATALRVQPTRRGGQARLFLSF